MVKKKEKLSVVFLYDDSLDRTDGVSHQVKTLGKWLSQQGHSVCYFVGQTELKSWAGGRVYSLSKNIMVPFNGNRVATPLLANLQAIKRALGEQNIDVLHVQLPYSPMMAQRVINRVSKNVAVVGTFHILPANYLARYGTYLLRFVYGRSLRRFDKLIAVSPAAAVFAKQSLGINADILSNAVDTTWMRIGSPRNKKNHIVYLGRLVSRKGCAELLRAFVVLKKSIPSAKLTIAGDGPQRAGLEAYVRKNGLDSSVEFTGFIAEKDKPGLLASAAIACFPSLGGESFGIVLVEAMAAGAGVVMGGDNPGYASVLGKDSGALVNPRRSTLFAHQLEKYMTDKNAAEGLHTKQQEIVKQYDVAVVGKNLLKVYRQAIAKKNHNLHNIT